MPRDPRYIPANSLQHVVDTTFQNRFLLRPSKTLNDRFLGVLGRAQRESEMPICGVVVASNHYHLLLQPKDGKHLAEFMCFLKTNLAKELGTRLHGWKGAFFSGRYHSTTVSDEEIDQVGVLRYLLSHGTKEFLVDRVRQWPGVHCADALVRGTSMKGRWYDRTAECEARARAVNSNPEVHSSNETVRFSPLPCWQNLSKQQIRRAVRFLVEEIDLAAKTERRAAGKSSLGVRRILAMEPEHRPDKVEVSPKPRFHAADPAVRQELREVLQEIIKSFREASEKLRTGDRLAVFPEGTFPPSMAFLPFAEPLPNTRGQPA